MTIDEAIELEIYNSKAQELIAKRCDDASGYSRYPDERIRTTEAKTCEERAKEHRQLAEWLKELKRQREAWEKVKAEIETERDDCQIYKLHYAFWDGEDYAYKECLNIIDKHLQEVTIDEDCD